MKKATEKQSARDRLAAIRRAIDEAQTQVKLTATRIKELDAQITAALGKLNPDPGSIEELESQREAATALLSRLERRVEALEGSLPTAKEAVTEEELNELLDSYPSVLEASNAAVMRWRKAVEALDELVEAAAEVREATWKWQVHHDRIRYLEYLLGRTSADLTRREYIPPDEVERAKARLQAGFELTRFPGLLTRPTEWARKLDELRSKRAAEDRQRLLDEEYARQARLAG